MGILGRIFGQSARKNFFPPPPADAPPQPEGYWNIIVDENGERVTDRPAAATDFIARRPVEYIDGGTEPAFKKDPRQNETQNAQAMVDYEIRSNKNREHLQKAVFLLSQTDDGVRLLQKAKEMKFTLVFDSESCAEMNAVGLCDYANKKIPLAEGRSAAEVALTLKHELQHMEDISRGMAYDLSDTPRNAILVNRALEGNARVSEAVAAAEAMMGSPHGPARQFRTAALFNCMWNKNPEIAKEADAAMPDAAAGKWTQFAAKVLPAYFRETATLAYYDNNYYKYIEKFVPDVSNSIQQAKNGDYQHRAAHQRRVEQTKSNANTLFTHDRWTPEKLASLLTIRGLPYTQDMGKKGFSLASDAAVALTEKAPALFEKLKKNIQAVLPESDKPAQLDLPVAKTEKPAVPAANPYARHASKLEPETEFAVIRLPNRVDGSKLTNGMRSHESTTQLFGDIMKNMNTGGTQTDRINYSVGQYLHHNRGVANVRGLVGNLLQAGLIAPLGAFPEEYTFDLCKRVMLSVREHNGRPADVSPHELKLLDHWQQMKDKGLDPMWIDAPNKQASWVARPTHHKDVYAEMLLSALKDNHAATQTLATAQSRPAAGAK